MLLCFHPVSDVTSLTVFQQLPGDLRTWSIRFVAKQKASSQFASLASSLQGVLCAGTASGLEFGSFRGGHVGVHHLAGHAISCSPPSRRWVSPPDRRCPRRPHSRWALHPEPAAAGAAAGAGAAVAAPGRLRQPPGSGGWAPGAEKLPPHPSPSSHSLEGKTKAERRT